VAITTGAVTTTNILSDQKEIDISNVISQLEPDMQPLTVFSRGAGKAATVATEFSWLEETAKPRFDQVNGAHNSSVTTVAVDNGTYYQQWDLILITRTGEMMRVDAVSTNNLTVTRGIGSTAAAILDNDEVMILSSGQPENDTSKPPRFDVPVKTSNHTQIFRTPFELSGSLMASGYAVSPTEWNRQQRNKGQEHVKDIEYAFLLGRKSATTPGATQVRTTGGALSFMTANQTDAGGDLSEAEFNAFMLQAMRFGTKRKLALGSGVGVSALNKFPASKQQTTNNEKTYGMDVTTYTSPFGSLRLAYHPLLEGTKYGGYILVLDMDQVRYRFLSANGVSRDTKILTNRQPNDQDGRKDEILAEIGLQFGQARTHGVLSGITS
jgi:hypothetical protein